MRTLLAGLVLGLILLVGTILVLPSLIDWNQYRGRLADEVRNITGRTLTVHGDLSLRLFPQPALAAENVTLSNLPDARDPVMASMEALRVRLSLPALLHGRVEASAVEIIRPTLLLEQLPNGQRNWILKTGVGGGGSAGGPLPPLGRSPPRPAPGWAGPGRAGGGFSQRPGG
ncbi:AsmA family protein [Pararhodospirillum photometricum]|uniref:AsmA n=1 Tax=Pararhodospirillum photometricum DSM 122 TaxID=1150469 RepID=H6SK55_PARPM|nr:AsmA family protein [Pararhodospirillum photometricum]CCG08370.1 AsmA [Pararhodospirillum photometricum DSM 122]